MQQQAIIKHCGLDNTIRCGCVLQYARCLNIDVQSKHSTQKHGESVLLLTILRQTRQLFTTCQPDPELFTTAGLLAASPGLLV